MKLSIFCLNYSASHYSSTHKYHICLEHLFTHPPSCEFEVILIDNGSTDNSVEEFRQRWGDKISIIPLSKNLGYHVSHNKGISKSSSEYIMILNPDVEVTEGMFDTLIRYMDTHEDVALTGAQLLNKDGSIQDSYRTFMKPTDFLIKRLKFLHKISYFKKKMIRYLMWNFDNRETQEVEWVIAGCCIIRKKMFIEVGGFDERYFLFNGDTDLCKKFWRKGWKVVYLPEAKAYHGEARLSGNGFWGALFKKTAWIHLRDMVRYFLKWKNS